MSVFSTTFHNRMRSFLSSESSWAIISGLLLAWFVITNIACCYEMPISIVSLFARTSHDNGQLILQLSTVVVVVVTLSSQITNNRILMIGWIWYAYALISSGSIGEGNQIFLQILPIVICCMTTRQLSRFIPCMLVITFLVFTLSFLKYICGVNQFVTSGYYLRASGIYKSPNTLYSLGLSTIYFSLWILKSRLSGWINIALPRITFILAFLMVILTGNRLGMVALIVSIWGLRLRSPIRISRNWIVVASLLVAFLITMRFVHSNRFLIDKSLVNRPVLWQDGIQVFMEKPLFGHGVSGFALSTLSQERMASGIYYPIEPKNLMIALLDSFGILGTVIVILFYSQVLATPCSNHESRWLYLMCCTAFLIAGIADTPIIIGFDRLPGTFLFSTITGLYLHELFNIKNVDVKQVT